MTAGKSVLITFSEPRVVIRHSQAVLQLLCRVLLKQAALGSPFTSTNQKFLDFLVHSSTQSRSEHYRRNLARVQFIESFARVFSNLSMLQPISSRWMIGIRNYGVNYNPSRSVHWNVSLIIRLLGGGGIKQWIAFTQRPRVRFLAYPRIFLNFWCCQS